MYKLMKVLAIAALIITIAGAGAVLYGIHTFEPVIEQVQVTVTPASQAQEIFDSVMAQVQNSTFTGRVFAQPAMPDSGDCTFLTYTVRLANKGFFPAEWIALNVTPVQDDLLQLDNVQANVLAAGSRGDIAATILHAGDASQTQRTFTVSGYVFGRKILLEGSTP